MIDAVGDESPPLFKVIPYFLFSPFGLDRLVKGVVERLGSWDSIQFFDPDAPLSQHVPEFIDGVPWTVVKTVGIPVAEVIPKYEPECLILQVVGLVSIEFC